MPALESTKHAALYETECPTFYSSHFTALSKAERSTIYSAYWTAVWSTIRPAEYIPDLPALESAEHAAFCRANWPAANPISCE